MTYQPTSLDDGISSVLIVDDSIGIRKFLAVALRRLGVSPLEAPDIATARDYIGGVDAVILDMGLTDGDGLEYLEEFRRDPALADLPVIVLTVRNDSASRAKAKDLGVAEWITKPFRTEEFVAALSTILPGLNDPDMQ